MVGRKEIVVHDALLRVQELFRHADLKAADNSTKYKALVKAMEELVKDCEQSETEDAQSYDKIRQCIKHLDNGRSEEWLSAKGYTGNTIRKAVEQRDKKAVYNKMAAKKCSTCGAKIWKNRDDTCIACSTKKWMERK